MPRTLLIALVIAGVPATAIADEDMHWPVRLNLQMPIGYSWGREELHGFTWGFRGNAVVVPGSHGTAFGIYADMSMDTSTSGYFGYGAQVAVPIRSFADEAGPWLDWRMAGFAGVRYPEGVDPPARLNLGLGTEMALPAYLYEFRVGLRLDGTFDGASLVSTSLLFDLDLAALIAAYAAAAGS